MAFKDGEAFSFTMPAGKYYVGDPCYVVSDETWKELLKQIIVGPNCLDGKFVLPNGRVIVAISTAFGDGEYESNLGHLFNVDSGCLGLVPVKKADRSADDDTDGSCAIVKFTEPFEVRSNGKGLINFGTIIIDTTKTTDEREDDDEDF